MTYDPREGSSPYLDTDVDAYDDFDATSADYPAGSVTTRMDRGSAGRPQAARAEAERDVPATLRRSSQAPRRGIAPQVTAPGRAYAPAPARNAVSAPAQAPYVPKPRTSGVQDRIVGAVGMMGLYLAALAARLMAIVLAAVMVTSAFSFTSGHMRQTIVSMGHLTALLAPSALLGRFVVETPFGGLLRGDLALVSCILFGADWLCMKLLASLRNRRERGA